MEEKFRKSVASIQASLIAPKKQYNSFGKYSYRSAEDILEAVKPLLNKEGLILTLSDEIVMLGTRFYVKATATITNGSDTLSSTGFARESEEKKGQDASQLTGATSSYARKYALNGLLCIDDNKDADAANTHDEKMAQVANRVGQAVDEVKNATTTAEVKAIWAKYPDLHNTPEFKDCISVVGTRLKEAEKK